MLDSLYKLNIHPTTLAWFTSFFNRRTFRVVADGVAPKSTDVTSGVIQGSVLSPVCFCIFLDQLLQAMSEFTGPDSYAFAGDLNLLQVSHQENITKLNLLSILSTAGLRIIECLCHSIKAVFCIAEIKIQSCCTFLMTIRNQ